jgi:predicted double-glycine peptidase
MDTIRSYNAHLSRVEVRTYKDLIDSAERALNFENESTRSAAQSLAISPQSEETAKNSASSEEDPWAETLQAEDPWFGNLRAQNPQAEDPWAENPRAESTWAEEPPF